MIIEGLYLVDFREPSTSYECSNRKDNWRGQPYPSKIIFGKYINEQHPLFLSSAN